MVISRRTFVRGAALAVATAPLISRAASAAGGLYTPNAAPLAPTAFLRLPPGSVRAAGWLNEQLHMELGGLTGRYQDISHFLDYSTTGWITPANVGWEEVPYWLRGYGDLAYATGDATALSTTERWITGILATQQSDGFFGPTSLRTSLNGGPDFWPYLPLVKALRMFGEYSGDGRIVPALHSFFRYMATQPGSVFSSSWVSYRLADALDSLFWLYNRTGDTTLLTLADTIHTWAELGEQHPHPAQREHRAGLLRTRLLRTASRPTLAHPGRLPELRDRDERLRSVPRRRVRR